MRTLLFATMYLNAEEQLTRYRRYLSYYLPRLRKLGADRLMFIDDGSDRALLDQLFIPVYEAENMPNRIDPIASIVTFKEHLGRPILTLIPGWWRSFSSASILAAKFDIEKLIHIESDSYILSDNLFNWIKNGNDVWSTLWSKKYWWPETCIQVIPKPENIKKLELYFRLGKEFWWKNGLCNQQYIPEYILPVEYIEKGYRGDRVGEDWYKQPIEPYKHDYVCNMDALSSDNQKYTANDRTKIEQFFMSIGLGDIY